MGGRLCSAPYQERHQVEPDQQKAAGQNQEHRPSSRTLPDAILRNNFAHGAVPLYLDLARGRAYLDLLILQTRDIAGLFRNSPLRREWRSATVWHGGSSHLCRLIPKILVKGKGSLSTAR